jgi:hypothetical protein
MSLRLPGRRLRDESRDGACGRPRRACRSAPGMPVEKGLHCRSVAAHLLRLVRKLGHDLVDRTLHEVGRDRLAASTPGSIVHHCAFIASEVAQQLANPLLETQDASYVPHIPALRPAAHGREFASRSPRRPCHKRYFAHSTPRTASFRPAGFEALRGPPEGGSSAPPDRLQVHFMAEQRQSRLRPSRAVRRATQGSEFSQFRLYRPAHG